ncbi:SDR family oxidoreductase [Variovorax sp. RA8]|uniref:SDR family oxidoreductase n=1 Tax=Variovorax sp. (strain JCM 16519 / RA8) TaxID=662548 RepID=UPI0013161DFD|nr:SDR family NAD(P)-dependent oxidoreductase [Variovorax sp. RA8]VTU42548.1 putative oxidoreductase [Variovorax sp. RA8]
MTQVRTQRFAWITGAGSGIGRAAALALAQAGHVVALSGRRADALQAVAGQVAAQGGTAHSFVLDVRDSEAVTSTFAAIERDVGPVDVLVNSAGINVTARSWAEVGIAAWRQVVDVNLTGTFQCMHAVLPSMRARRDGLVINVASWAGRHASPLVGPGYNATKHAVVALTHSFNMEEGRNGLRACVLMPGETDTPILDQRPVPVLAQERARMLQEHDLGQTVAFLASMPGRVCVNEILISPTHNRAFGA